MNDILIKSRHEIFQYRHKQDTRASFYLFEGRRNVLPERISYDENGFFSIQKKGRALTEIKKGQIIGYFRKDEYSEYKRHKPNRFFSTIWQALNYPLFVGYGDIGVSNREGKIESSNDFFILYKPSNDVLEIHLFKSLVQGKDYVLKYLTNYIRRQDFLRAC
jgi:hypothetical protein